MFVTGCETEKLLDDTKILLGMETAENDDRLRLIIEDTVNAILAYCRLEFLPGQLCSLVPRMCASAWHSLSFTGDREIASLAEGDRSVTFSTGSTSAFADNYKNRLKPFINKRAQLPSEADRYV